MTNLLENGDQIKAVAKNCTGTPTAKLIAILEAAGVTSSAEIADLIGVKVRAVQAARKRTTMRATECGAPQCAHHNAQTHQDAPKNAPQCVSAPRARIDNNKLTNLEDNPVSSEVSEVGKKSQKPPKRNASPRGARLQPDWSLPDAWREWTRINFAHASPELVATEADKFRDYWIAKSGQQAAKLDWEATWRNWCRTAFSAKPSAHPINVGRMGWDEKRAASHARARELAAKYAGAVQ